MSHFHSFRHKSPNPQLEITSMNIGWGTTNPKLKYPLKIEKIQSRHVAAVARWKHQQFTQVSGFPVNLDDKKYGMSLKEITWLDKRSIRSLVKRQFRENMGSTLTKAYVNNIRERSLEEKSRKTNGLIQKRILLQGSGRTQNNSPEGSLENLEQALNFTHHKCPKLQKLIEQQNKRYKDAIESIQEKKSFIMNKKYKVFELKFKNQDKRNETQPKVHSERVSPRPLDDNRGLVLGLDLPIVVASKPCSPRKQIVHFYQNSKHKASHKPEYDLKKSPYAAQPIGGLPKSKNAFPKSHDRENES